MNRPNYDELDPGIREVVRWLNENNFETTDSGDGVTKIAAGWSRDEALDFPHVAIHVASKYNLVEEADALRDLLEANGITVSELGPDPNAAVCIQADYDPVTGLSGITLTGLTDAKLVEGLGRTG